jgi:hypothetical protein
MDSPVQLPLWLFLLLVVLALVAVLDRLLVPGVRRFLRTRVNRVVDELNLRRSPSGSLPDARASTRSTLQPGWA